MAERTEVRLSGYGGQGLITAGIILAEAALKEGKQVVQTQSYGPEARGGASRAEVMISSGKIDYPKVSEPNVLLAMSQEAYIKYLPSLHPEGLLIVDSSLVQKTTGTTIRFCALPITELAKVELGKVIVANIVALGVITALTNVVGYRALEEAVLARVPQGTLELNRRALQFGYRLGTSKDGEGGAGSV